MSEKIWHKLNLNYATACMNIHLTLLSINESNNLGSPRVDYNSPVDYFSNPLPRIFHWPWFSLVSTRINTPPSFPSNSQSTHNTSQAQMDSFLSKLSIFNNRFEIVEKSNACNSIYLIKREYKREVVSVIVKSSGCNSEK